MEEETKEKIRETIKKARDLYNKGEWKEARDMLLPLLKEDFSFCPEPNSELNRLLGWCYYYLGKKKIEAPRHCGREAEFAWLEVLKLQASEVDTSSALNGLPLAYQYLLDDSKRAVKFADMAIEKAVNPEERAKAFNSKGLVEKDAGLILAALNSFSKAYECASVANDKRTAGHALNNRARTLMMLLPEMVILSKLGARTGLIEEIKTLFFSARDLYKQSEMDIGENADSHLKGVQEQLQKLAKLTN